METEEPSELINAPGREKEAPREPFWVSEGPLADLLKFYLAIKNEDLLTIIGLDPLIYEQTPRDNVDH